MSSTGEQRLLARAIERGREAVVSLAEEVRRKPMPLTCWPPPPIKPFPYGDMVPLGFLLRAIENLSAPVVRRDLEDLLRSKRQGLLWSYHEGTLVTCIDSALILQGLRDTAGLEALEVFADGRGGYLPQLCSEEPERDKMTVTVHNRHWCQAEYVTTCLVAALRREAGLECKTRVGYLADGYENRSGLYFANPYMTDWALAWALRLEPSAVALREQLADDILASANEDGSFGRYDVPMSTALAILALTFLGAGGEAVRRAKSRLARSMLSENEQISGVPFYSAMTIPQDRLTAGTWIRLMLEGRQGQLAWLGGDVYAVSFYVDTHKMISTALATLALTQPGIPIGRYAPSQIRADCHARYRCKDHMEYITRYALPPYVTAG